VHEENWRTPKYLKEKIKISSIGLGTQSGNLDNETDKKMFKVLFDGIKDGKINTIDTDVNFRYGKS
jgi:aryl-alcohol dehydrogenase-like predicted oxidoreductase